MSEPRTRLDQAMTERSLEIRKRWVQIAREADITTSALSGIRRGQYKPGPHTARALEDALQWAPGSIAAILNGGEPAPADRRLTVQDEAHVTESATVTREDPELTELFEEALDRRAHGDPTLYDTLMAIKRMNEARRHVHASDAQVDKGSQQAG